MAVKYALTKVLFNEVFYLFHMNEIHVPSIVMPIPGFHYEDSGVPCSLLLYGLDDRELLSISLSTWRNWKEKQCLALQRERRRKRGLPLRLRQRAKGVNFRDVSFFRKNS